MDENLLKQRLVGASVLVALAVIFLPSLFQKNERVVVDATSQIPPAPAIETVVIPKPEKPENIQVPSAQELFQPEVIESPKSSSKSKPIAPATETLTSEPPTIKPKAAGQSQTKPKSATKEKAQKPRLNEKGVPIGWVVQVASFKAQESANKLTDRLLKEDYRAYSRSVTTDKGVFYRVFVGPFVDEKRANSIKKSIDKTYKLQSRVSRFNPVSGG